MSRMLDEGYGNVLTQDLVNEASRLLAPSRDVGGDTALQLETVLMPSRVSLMELQGLGREVWAGVDAQDYVDGLRDEWDSD